MSVSVQYHGILFTLCCSDDVVVIFGSFSFFLAFFLPLSLSLFLSMCRDVSTKGHKKYVCN